MRVAGLVVLAVQAGWYVYASTAWMLRLQETLMDGAP